MLEPIDESDLDQLLGLPAWDHVVRRITGMLEQQRETCERADSNLLVLKAQGGAAMLRRVLAVPEILRDELKKR